MVFPVTNPSNKINILSDFHTDILVMIFKLAEENLRALLLTCKTFNRIAHVVSGRTKFAGMMNRHLIIKIEKHWDFQMFRQNELILVKRAYYSPVGKNTVDCLNLKGGSHSSVELDPVRSINYDDKKGYFSTYYEKGDVSFIDFSKQTTTHYTSGEDSCSHKEKALQLQKVGDRLHLVDRGNIIQSWSSVPRFGGFSNYDRFWIIEDDRFIIKCRADNFFVFSMNSAVPVLKNELRKYRRIFDTPAGYLALIAPPYSKEDKPDPWEIHLLSKENFRVVKTFTSEAFRTRDTPIDGNYLLTLNNEKIHLHNLADKTSHEITSTKGNYFKLSFPFAAIVNPGFTHDHLEIWNVSARVKIYTISFFGRIDHISLSKDHVLVKTDRKIHIFSTADFEVSDKVESYYVQGFWQSFLYLVNRVISFVKNFFHEVIKCQ